MTKPLHAGAAAMSGIQAARLAARDWTSHPEAFDGTTGFRSAFLGWSSIRHASPETGLGEPDVDDDAMSDRRASV
jgi:2-methylcitrate dehydratase PrpD